MNKNDQHLKSAEIYFENGIPYMKLVYEYENEIGILEVVFPKVEFPFNVSSIPNTYTDKLSSLNYPYQNTTYIESDVDQLHVFAGDASIETENGVIEFKDVYQASIITKTKVHEMTLEEIEKKLGYPVKIVSKEKEKKNNA